MLNPHLGVVPVTPIKESRREQQQESMVRLAPPSFARPNVPSDSPRLPDATLPPSKVRLVPVSKLRAIHPHVLLRSRTNVCKHSADVFRSVIRCVQCGAALTASHSQQLLQVSSFQCHAVSMLRTW